MEFIMNSITDNSSDEDDPYTNSVARLRALKKQRLETDQPSSKDSIEQETNGEDMNGVEVNTEAINNEDIVCEEINTDGIQTRSRMVRGRRNKTTITRSINRRGRRRHSPIDLQYDVEIVREEKADSCKDAITLSDDDGYKEDDNYEMNIKVFWRSYRMDRLSIRRHDSLKEIFQHYADLEGVSVNQVLIMKKDKIVNHSDTPESLKLSIVDILDGGIVNADMNVLSEEKNDEDTCTIKVQMANKKESLIILLKKDEQFKALFASCAEQLGVKENNLKLYFDGEQINSSDTPESLDLEGEACVDLHIFT